MSPCARRLRSQAVGHRRRSMYDARVPPGLWGDGLRGSLVVASPFRVELAGHRIREMSSSPASALLLRYAGRGGSDCRRECRLGGGVACDHDASGTLLAGPHSTTRRYRECHEVSAQPLGGCRRHVGGVKQPAELFARAQDLTPARPPPTGVGRGQIEQLEGAPARTPTA
jgi:hypothetical protein